MKELTSYHNGEEACIVLSEDMGGDRYQVTLTRLGGTPMRLPALSLLELESIMLCIQGFKDFKYDD